MKYLITIACCLFLAAGAQAQFQPGDSFINGSVGFVTGENLPLLFEGESTIFTFAPGFGYFISNRTALGLSASYRFISTEFEDGRSFGITPSVRYYKGVAPNFGFWLEYGPDLAFGSSELKFFSSSEREWDSFTVALGLRPGIYYFMGERFALEASFGSLSYFFTREEEKGTGRVTKRNGLVAGLSSGIGGTLSVSYFFRRGLE